MSGSRNDRVKLRQPFRQSPRSEHSGVVPIIQYWHRAEDLQVNAVEPAFAQPRAELDLSQPRVRHLLADLVVT
jgi:hypothetical protein